jgi:hypothetical protein
MWLNLIYLQWINFWRLPETSHSKRCESEVHRQKIRLLKTVWSISLILLSLVGGLLSLVIGGLLLTFLSFMLLDEV